MDGELVLSVQVIELLLLIAEGAYDLCVSLSAGAVEANGVLPKAGGVEAAGLRCAGLWQVWHDCAFLLVCVHSKNRL